MMSSHDIFPKARMEILAYFAPDGPFPIIQNSTIEPAVVPPSIDRLVPVTNPASAPLR
jgi:hypothetical protein